MTFPATYNFDYYQGDTYEFLIRPKDSVGNNFDLTNYTGLFTVATERGKPASIVGSAQTASVDTSLSTVKCRISSTFGASLTGNSYVYDVQIKNPSTSAVFTLVTGTISVTRDITNTGSG
jgi:F0F1-type ATP synthase beta subunit